ncbi:MAG: FHA domain-containing protein [Ilumatobacteraceae bacterium]
MTSADGSALSTGVQLWLQIDEPGDEAALICIVEEAVIGRDFRSDVVIHDDEASRMHARVTPIDGQEWIITDLATTNGTFVNAARIVGPAKIGPGDMIRVGRVTCTVVHPPIYERH